MNSILPLLLFTASASGGINEIPTNVVELAATSDYRYVSTFGCSEEKCGHKRYLQKLGYQEVTCSKEISEISGSYDSAYPVWKDRPQTLYLTIIDLSASKSYIAKVVTGKDCDYQFHMEPLTQENAAESAKDGS